MKSLNKIFRRKIIILHQQEPLTEITVKKPYNVDPLKNKFI